MGNCCENYPISSQPTTKKNDKEKKKTKKAKE